MCENILVKSFISETAVVSSAFENK